MDPSLLYYFSYGSNLMNERMKIENKSATFFSIAKLKQFRLVFTQCHNHINRWGGAVASIYESGDENDEVWGVVYTLVPQQIDKLANQESDYKQVPVSAELPDGQTINCISYIHHKQAGPNKELPGPDSVPSYQYLSVLVYGAKQNGLPKHYTRFLETHQARTPTIYVSLFDELVELSEGRLNLIAN